MRLTLSQSPILPIMSRVSVLIVFIAFFIQYIAVKRTFNIPQSLLEQVPLTNAKSLKPSKGIMLIMNVQTEMVLYWNILNNLLSNCLLYGTLEF